MTPKHTFIHLARITLEARTALSIASGKGDSLLDAPVALDANGLPTLPGSSLAGVLRAQVYRNDPVATERLFGQSNKGQEQRSRVEISWGSILAANGKPMLGLQPRTSLLADPILGPLLREGAPKRDHVRLSERGTAADRGKFDRSYVPPGHRFALEVALWSRSAAEAEKDWNFILTALHSPDLRLGGATRRGYGHMAVHSCHMGAFDLAKPEDFAAFSALSSQPGALVGLKQQDFKAIDQTWIRASLELTPEDFWRVGSGDLPLARHGKEPDMLPASIVQVDWSKSSACLTSRRLVVPGSSVKGVLAHRAAYHHRRLTGVFAGDADPVGEEARNILFGHAKESREAAGSGEGGRAGCIFIDDIYLTPGQIAVQQHNSIDRFTGGVRNGVLFSEELVWKHPLPLAISIDRVRLAGVPRLARRAFDLAVRDLVEGRLAIGAAASRGHGYVRGTQVSWSDSGLWLQQGEEQ